MFKKYALIIKNPIAGKIKNRDSKIHTLINILSKHLFSYKTCVTGKKGDAVEFIKCYAKDADIIVCCGGDGTLHEIVNGLINENLQTPIYYFPTGTTNDMARTLCLSNNKKPAADLLLNGLINDQDAGVFNGNICLTYSASFGAFTDISYNTPQWIKNRLGYCAYWIYGFKSLSSIKPYQAIITTDNQTFEGRFIFGCVSNSTSIGGILKLADQKVDLCDGRMELLLIRYPKSPAELGQLIFDVARGKYSNKNIIFTQAERISVRFQNDVD